MALTLGTLETSLYLTIGLAIISLIYNVYTAIMNWRQAKVRDDLKELIDLTKKQNELLKEKK